MAKQIVAAVRAQREVIEGVGQQDALTELISQYATRSLYLNPDAETEDLRQAIVGRLAKEYLPEAQRAGMNAASSILDGIGGSDLVRKGSQLRGGALADFKRYHRSNLAALEAELDKETGGLSAEIKAAFARAERDGVARKQLIEDLVASDRAELERLATVRREEIRPASKALAQAEAEGNERQIADARDALKQAKAKIRTTKSFLARFETAVQGRARDAVRRECQQAQFSAFKQAGFATGAFAWVAINGPDACPQCVALHGTKKTAAQWRGQMPGDGQTYCGAACECQLVPEEFLASNPVAGPVTVQ